MARKKKYTPKAYRLVEEAINKTGSYDVSKVAIELENIIFESSKNFNCKKNKYDSGTLDFAYHNLNFTRLITMNDLKYVINVIANRKAS